MIDDILNYIDKLGRIFSALKINLVIGVIVNLVVIYVLFKMTDILMNKLKNKFSSNEKNSPINNIFPILERVIKFLILFIITASFLQSQGYSLTSLIAGFGITGLAVGFAAQQTIASMFGTITVLSDKVYKIGDYIKIKEYEGFVEKISIRSTKIRTLDNYLVTIPNDICADSIIENVSSSNKRKIDITFTITYNTSDEKIQRAKDIIKEIISERTDIHKDYHIFVDELDKSSINIRFFGYAKTKSYFNCVEIRGKIFQDVVKRYRNEGIDFAFPSQTVYLAKE